jgi:hypothetical protein
MDIHLNDGEVAFLVRPIQGQGGFKSLLRRLRARLNSQTGALRLTARDLEQIPRYAFDYHNGGFQGRLLGIFERHLGSCLGRAG